MGRDPYFVEETACYPNSFRVQVRGGGMSNWPSYFHPSREEAQAHADRMNAAVRAEDEGSCYDPDERRDAEGRTL